MPLNARPPSSFRYERLVGSFPAWLDELLAALAPSYNEATRAMLRAALVSRHARAFPPDGKHKRSVAPGRYDAEVSAATVHEMRRLHHEWWEELGYR